MRFEAKTVNDTRKIEAAVSLTSLKPGEISAALETGARKIQKATQQTVAFKARSHPRGQLGKSITYTKPTGGPAFGVTHMGWEKLKLKKASTRNRREGGVYKGKRVVSTVDDYARILEYSPNYQLRHAEEAFEANADAACAAIEKDLDEAVARLTNRIGL